MRGIKEAGLAALLATSSLNTGEVEAKPRSHEVVKKPELPINPDHIVLPLVNNPDNKNQHEYVVFVLKGKKGEKHTVRFDLPTQHADRLGPGFLLKSDKDYTATTPDGQVAKPTYHRFTLEFPGPVYEIKGAHEAWAEDGVKHPRIDSLTIETTEREQKFAISTVSMATR